MKRFIFKDRYLSSKVKLNESLKRLCRRACLLLLVLSVLFIPVIPVSAAVSGFVVKDSDGSFHQYCYEELLDSYAMKMLGSSNGLYEDFASKKPYALLDSVTGYVDYADILDQYARVFIRGEKFYINRYTESAAARRAELPGTIKAVSVIAGKLMRTTLILDHNNPDNPPPGETPDPEEVATPIVFPSTVSLSRAQQWAKAKGAHQRFIDIAPLYWEYGKKTGIRPEILYAQSAYETGFGRFTGIVPPEHNNWAGIKTASASGDDPEDYERFATPEEGVRAHFNHISAYVGVSPVGEPHGRYHLLLKISWAGTVKTAEELSGKWAPSPTYHERIISLLFEIE